MISQAVKIPHGWAKWSTTVLWYPGLSIDVGAMDKYTCGYSQCSGNGRSLVNFSWQFTVNPPIHWFSYLSLILKQFKVLQEQTKGHHNSIACWRQYLPQPSSSVFTAGHLARLPAKCSTFCPSLHDLWSSAGLDPSLWISSEPSTPSLRAWTI